VEAGLVWGKELYFDTTKVEANASLDSMRSRSLMEHGLEEHLVGIFPEEGLQPVEEVANAPQIPAVGPAGREARALSEANAKRHRWIEKAGRQQREVVRWGYRRIADLRVSATDPDASPMQHKKKGASRLGYQTHYVVDGGKARVILDVCSLPPRRSPRTSPCSSCSSGTASVGICARARSPATRPTAPSRTWRPWRRPASAPTWRCPNTTNAVPSLASTPSPTTPKRTSTSAPEARACAGKVTTTRRDPSGTQQRVLLPVQHMSA
jgi:hypothetical protein